MLEKHPDLYLLAEEYENKTADIKGKRFQWCEEMRLSEMRRPENVQLIQQRHAVNKLRRWENRSNKKLVETLADLEDEQDDTKGCAICHL